ncbi:MAG: helix-turn-helix transcriptional regulator [Saprospiraceae bacterium]|nr:helix-turn-helix transcriptional regulator [Saprospiraceae bacterium]
MSRTHLYRKIKHYLSSSFTEILTTMRIDLAKELLHNSSLNISEIAYQVGFRDPSYFVRVFRKQTGKTPRFYRTGRE